MDFIGQPDGYLVTELALMQEIQKQTATTQKTDFYTCKVAAEPILECLDIGAAGMLGGLNVSNVAYDDTTGNYERLGYDAYTSGSTLFGQTCGAGYAVGDGVVNAFDIAALLWAHFRQPPYDLIDTRPDAVYTTNGRGDTVPRCQSDVSGRLDWQLKLADGFCPGSTGLIAGLNHLVEPSIIEPSTIAASFKLEVTTWAFGGDAGAWWHIYMPGNVIATDLYFTGLRSAIGSTEVRGDLSNEPPPRRGCANCQPRYTPSDVTITYKRRSGFNQDANCAAILPASSSALIDGTISLRQSPPQLACPFDIIIWVPAGLDATVRVADSKDVGRRLREQTAGTVALLGNRRRANEIDSQKCDGEAGVLAGSAVMLDTGAGIVRHTVCSPLSLSNILGTGPPPPPAPQCAANGDFCSVGAVQLLGGHNTAIGYDVSCCVGECEAHVEDVIGEDGAGTHVNRCKEAEEKIDIAMSTSMIVTITLAPLVLLAAFFLWYYFDVKPIESAGENARLTGPKDATLEITGKTSGIRASSGGARARRIYELGKTKEQVSLLDWHEVRV